MKLKSIPAKFIRGGTSKGIYINTSFLPSNLSEIDDILLRIMGSPDATGLQMNGMGGGLTTTSKVALVSKKIINKNTFLNYKLGQVSINEKKIDWSGNCGNLASGLFEFVKYDREFHDCVEKITPENSKNSDGNRAPIARNIYSDKIRIWQENKKHEIYLWGNLGFNEKENDNLKDQISISGIQGLSDPIFVEFKNLVSEGSSLFPTGNLIDKMQIRSLNNSYVEASLISGSNPQVIINPDSLGLKGNELAKEIDYEKIRIPLNEISSKAADLMKIPLNHSLKISWVSRPQFYTDTSGNPVNEDAVDILSRMNTGNTIHHSYAVTGAITLSIACNVKGTIANLALSKDRELKRNKSKNIIIGHPGGIIDVESSVLYNEKTCNWEVVKAGLTRTARLLMDGKVYY